MKRDLLFVLMRSFRFLDEWQLRRWRGSTASAKTGNDMLDKLFAAFMRRADEGTLSRLLVEASILLATGRSNGTSALRDAATVYKVDTDAIALKVKQEFAAKEKAKKGGKPNLQAGKSRKAA